MSSLTARGPLGGPGFGGGGRLVEEEAGVGGWLLVGEDCACLDWNKKGEGTTSESELLFS